LAILQKEFSNAMITKTFTNCFFYVTESPDFEYIRTFENKLKVFTDSQTDLNLENYLEELLLQKPLLDKEGITRIAVFHTLLYDYQCNMEFSPKVMSLMKELNATFCISTDLDSGNPRKVKLYDLLDSLRKRPGMYFGKASITLLNAFLDGYGTFHEQIDYGTPSFEGFNDFVDNYYGNYSSAGWKNKILSAHYNNEEEALEWFFKILDEYREAPTRPNSRTIIHHLLKVGISTLKDIKNSEEKIQSTALLQLISEELSDVVFGRDMFRYDDILQNVFILARESIFLHDWIKSNAPSTVQFEYELWSGSDGKVVITTVIPSNHQQKEIVLDPCEKLIKTFFAINHDKAKDVKDAFQTTLNQMEEQKKIIEQHKLSFFTEYYQFYILDSESEGKTDVPDFWNDEAGTRRLAIGEGILGVTVAKYAEIMVDVRVLSSEPTEDAYADHIVETSLNLPSGLLQIKDCTNYDTILELNLEKGTYRVRISSFKLWTVENDKGDDYYVVEIWKAGFSTTKVIKEYKSKI
jgi:hypothetical protein